MDIDAKQIQQLADNFESLTNSIEQLAASWKVLADRLAGIEISITLPPKPQ